MPRLYWEESNERTIMTTYPSGPVSLQPQESTKTIDDLLAMSSNSLNRSSPLLFSGLRQATAYRPVFTDMMARLKFPAIV